MKNISVATIAFPTPVDPTIGPLTLEHRQEYALVRKQAKAIQKAAAVAAINAWATAIAAAVSLPFAMFSLNGLVVVAALCGVAATEFRGRRRLLQFDTSAPSILGWNQIVFLAMIVAYCCWSIWSNLYGANSVTAQLQAFSEVDATLGGLEGVDAIVKHIVVLVYGSIIALSAVCQGLTALYYFTRRKHIDAYLAETPQWIRELQRSAHAH